MLRPADTANQGIDARIAETGVDDDGTADGLAGGLQQVPTAVHKAGHLLDRRNVSRVLAEVAELCQRKVWGQTDVVHHTAAPMHAVVVNAVRAAVAAATIILRRTSQMLFFFIIVVFFKMLINRVNCVCIMVLDYLSTTLQSYEKILRYASFSSKKSRKKTSASSMILKGLYPYTRGWLVPCKKWVHGAILSGASCYRSRADMMCSKCVTRCVTLEMSSYDFVYQ